MFFQWGPHKQRISHIFGYSNFKCKYLDNQVQSQQFLLTIYKIGDLYVNMAAIDLRVSSQPYTVDVAAQKKGN